MNTETELLKFIWENKGKASWPRVIKEMRYFSLDYCRLICKSLKKNKFIEFSDGQYKITALGRKELAKLGLIEKAEKVARPKKLRKPKRFKKPKKIVAKPKHIKRYVLGKKKIKGRAIAELSGLTPKLIEELKKKRFRTLEDVAIASASRLMETIEGLELRKAANMINEARDKLRKEGKECLWEE